MTTNLDFGVSSLLWSEKIEKQIIPILNSYLIKGIELAPYRKWGTWTPLKSDLIEYKNYLFDHSLKIISIQGITFSKEKDFNQKLLKNSSLWEEHFNNVLEIMKTLDCTVAVLGSPSLRSNSNDYELFLKMYKRTYQKFKCENKYLLLEAVPRFYKSNIVNNLRELSLLCRKNNFKKHVDIGCFFNEKEGKVLNDKESLFILNEINECFHLHIANRNLRNIFLEKETKNICMKFKLSTQNSVVFENISQSDNLTNVKQFLFDSCNVINLIN